LTGGVDLRADFPQDKRSENAFGKNGPGGNAIARRVIGGLLVRRPSDRRAFHPAGPRGARRHEVARYLSDVWRLRYFWMALVRIDLKNRYRRSLIGVGWSLLHPILMTIVLSMVFSTILKVDNIWKFAPYLLSGLIFWNYISSNCTQGCHCFFIGESYIRQHPAPLAIYPLRMTLGAGIHFLIGMAVVLLFVWYIEGFRNLPALANLIPVFILLFLFGWSLAILLGVANVLFQDCQHLIEVALQILFYLTPIFYRPEMLRQRHLDWFLAVNPMAVMLELLRTPILDGKDIPLSTYGIAWLVVCITTGAAVLTLARLERRMIFYL
jgi:lipopolysaccharide transport system permease protein